MSDNKILDKKEEQLLEAMGLGENGAMQKDYIAYAGGKMTTDTPKATRDDIINALKTVSDPEIMINIWDMGLVYKIEQNPSGDAKEVALAYASAGILPQQAADAVSSIEGVGLVTVKVVWEPAWTIENMSEEARAMFEFF